MDEAWIARALDLPFFKTPPPKSLDRNDFAALKLGEVAPADGAATLTAFTARRPSPASFRCCRRRPRSWIVRGGGARNLTMVRMLRERLTPATVEAAEGARLVLRSPSRRRRSASSPPRGLKGLPLSYPATTGVADADDRRGDRAAVIQGDRPIHADA